MCASWNPREKSSTQTTCSFSRKIIQLQITYNSSHHLHKSSIFSRKTPSNIYVHTAGEINLRPVHGKIVYLISGHFPSYCLNDLTVVALVSLVLLAYKLKCYKRFHYFKSRRMSSHISYPKLS